MIDISFRSFPGNGKKIKTNAMALKNVNFVGLTNDELIKNVNFVELTKDEAYLVNGGGWDEVVNITCGTVLAAHALPIAIGVSLGATPVVAVGVGVACVAVGVHMIAEGLD
ncbi:MAG: hypothetical protein PWR27_1950 [Petroclostridium sp.]|nr:hypothetical protein [Clostridia bacterium]MDK2811241.1 hypothetical protein [Petroclostridium sp.]